ncbi:acyl-CoA thioesterase [Flavicella sp.]|uniref:acyl-CoA thioesterase n=1 Tax=Flavicella sp. TaxID=2957742 RepID=UPI003018E15C
MSPLPKVIESKKKIRFQDCDPFNHLNNGRYVDYYINAREDQALENYNIDFFKTIEEEGLGWVIANNQVCYLKPVFTMETVVIESQLIGYSLKHFQIEMRMWNADKTILKSAAWFTFVPFNLRTNKVQIHQEKYTKIFREVLLEVPEKTFENREMYFRGRQRNKA